MALEGLVGQLLAQLAEPDLHGIVAFLGYGLLLNDGARTGFDDCDGDHGTVSPEELRHTKSCVIPIFLPKMAFFIGSYLR